MKRIIICALILAATSCRERDPLYCKSSADCKTAERPLCDLTGANPDSEGLPNTCVGTTGSDGGTSGDAGPMCPATCPTTSPICDPSTKECRPCAADSECSSLVCDTATGQCVAPSEIIYVTATGATSTPCGSAGTPCGLIPLGVQQLGSGIRTLHIARGTYPDALVLRGVQATVVGEAAVIDPAAVGQPALEVSDATGLATNLLVRGLVLQGAASGAVGEKGSGVHCSKGFFMPIALRLVGVDVADNAERGVYNENCTLSITRSTVQRNVMTGVLSVGGEVTIVDSTMRNNAAGVTCIGCSLIMERNVLSVGTRWALSLQESGTLVTPFKIVNNVFHGFADSATQGVIDIRGGNYGPTQFEFNTVALSTGKLINCQNSTSSIRTVIRNSIVFGDYDLSGNACRAEYILTKTPVAGDGNVIGDPQFVNPGTDFRLQGTSPARNAANNTEGITSDLDGRPRPSGRQADLGAFELP